MRMSLPNRRTIFLLFVGGEGGTNLTKSQGLGNLWIFKNGVKGSGFMGFPASVVDSIPGDQGYTPLWMVSIVDSIMEENIDTYNTWF